jgi:anaerobic selenocysteine-containing dehydrogenase
MGKLTRREFLKTVGKGAAIAGALNLAGCVEKEDPYALRKPPVPGEKGWYLGQEKWVMSSCAQCPAGCGIRVRIVKGRAIKIEGNPASPINRGRVGLKGQAGLQVLYNPDRIRHPLKRTGPRGSNKWKEISWNEAIAEVAKTLKKLRDEGKSHQLAVLCGRQRGFMVELWKRFCQVFGTLNFFDHISTSVGATQQAMNLMMGVDDLPGYDWENTSYVLNLGAALSESSYQGIFFKRLSAVMKRGHPGRRAKIVHVEPTYTLTTHHADEWIPIQPGTYDALALGIAHVLVKEGLYDKAFVESHSFGFYGWKDSMGHHQKGLRDILEDYPPGKVSAITDIPEKDIIRLAREMAKYRPALAIVDSRSTSTSNGLEIARAAMMLNALLGSVDRQGGVLVQRRPPLQLWQNPELDKIAQKGNSQSRIDSNGLEQFPFSSSVVEAIPEHIFKEKPYPIQVMFLYYSNPLFSRLNPERYRKAFEKIPSIISFSPFMDESSFYADIILPDHTYLERWEDAIPTPTVGYPVFGIRKPVVEPLYNTRNTGDVLIELSRSLDGIFKSNFPWQNFKEALEERISGLFKAKKGSIVTNDKDVFLESLYTIGHWENPPYRFEQYGKIFKTPSGKFEFYSQKIKIVIEQSSAHSKKSISELLQGWGQPESMNVVCLPHAEAPQWEGDHLQYPLYLIPYKPITYAEGSGANLPWLQELGDVLKGTRWDSCVEINPDTARKHGISDGDFVSVESPIGQIKTCAKIFAGIPPDAVMIVLGQGHTQMGRYASGRGVNPREILVAKVNPFSGIASLCGTKVKIVKL